VWRNLRDWCLVDGFGYLLKFVCWIYPAPKSFGQFKNVEKLIAYITKIRFFFTSLLVSVQSTNSRIRRYTMTNWYPGLFHLIRTQKQFVCWTFTACTCTVSGSISLPSQGFFSPFPHGTGSLSVNWEYLALEDGPPMFSQNVTCSDLLDSSLCQCRVRGYHPVSLHFPEHSTKSISTLGLNPFRSPLLRVSRLISFPTGT
jgi:hypothetical protein